MRRSRAARKTSRRGLHWQPHALTLQATLTVNLKFTRGSAPDAVYTYDALGGSNMVDEENLECADALLEGRSQLAVVTAVHPGDVFLMSDEKIAPRASGKVPGALTLHRTSGTLEATTHVQEPSTNAPQERWDGLHAQELDDWEARRKSAMRLIGASAPLI